MTTRRNPFPFPTLFPELQGEVVTHLEPLELTMLSLTSREMRRHLLPRTSPTTQLLIPAARRGSLELWTLLVEGMLSSPPNDVYGDANIWRDEILFKHCIEAAVDGRNTVVLLNMVTGARRFKVTALTIGATMPFEEEMAIALMGQTRSSPIDESLFEGSCRIKCENHAAISKMLLALGKDPRTPLGYKHPWGDWHGSWWKVEPVRRYLLSHLPPHPTTTTQQHEIETVIVGLMYGHCDEALYASHLAGSRSVIQEMIGEDYHRKNFLRVALLMGFIPMLRDLDSIRPIEWNEVQDALFGFHGERHGEPYHLDFFHTIDHLHLDGNRFASLEWLLSRSMPPPPPFRMPTVWLLSMGRSGLPFVQRLRGINLVLGDFGSHMIGSWPLSFLHGLRPIIEELIPGAPPLRNEYGDARYHLSYQCRTFLLSTLPAGHHWMADLWRCEWRRRGCSTTEEILPWIAWLERHGDTAVTKVAAETFLETHQHKYQDTEVKRWLGKVVPDLVRRPRKKQKVGV